ncbi:sugar transferase [Pseudarthrobacter oxydans]|uniref:sugar transferase n=1 Tax=Pseudarthrobacter oxydans TaxID=1671 RepID=UPI003ED04FCD
MASDPPGGYDALKRVLDLAIAIPVYVLTLPVQAVVALAVLIRMGRPVLFIQDRPGLGGKVFQLVKFRTMTVADDTTAPNEDSVRLTKLGRLLRATSLDELPSLVNVIIGDMSLVGPRPLLVSYMPLYTPEEARRHEVRPGITGLAQVSGRNLLTWSEKFELDVQYVDNRNLKLDLLILIRTVASVVKRHGVSAAGEATMPRLSRTPEENK